MISSFGLFHLQSCLEITLQRKLLQRFTITTILEKFLGISRSMRLLPIHPSVLYLDTKLTLRSYWAQRYKIFSKYDEGVWLTDDAWFGVTPEPVAK